MPTTAPFTGDVIVTWGGVLSMTKGIETDVALPARSLALMSIS